MVSEWAGVRRPGWEDTPVLDIVNDDGTELADFPDETGRLMVVRNGYHQPRKGTTAARVVDVKARRVNESASTRGRASAGGERRRLRSRTRRGQLT